MELIFVANLMIKFFRLPFYYFVLTKFSLPFSLILHFVELLNTLNNSALNHASIMMLSGLRLIVHQSK